MVLTLSMLQPHSKLTFYCSGHGQHSESHQLLLPPPSLSVYHHHPAPSTLNLTPASPHPTLLPAPPTLTLPPSLYLYRLLLSHHILIPN